jgi:putative transcriptional regulator
MRQSDLAEAVGVTRQTILAIEKGRLNPSILVCLRIAQALDQPLDAIFKLGNPAEVAPKPSDDLASTPN